MNVFEEFRDDAENDFERGVFERALESGGISEQDYEEAHSRYAECMEGAGVDEVHTKQPNGLYAREPAHLPDDDDAAEAYFEQGNECAEGTIASIEAAFNMQVNNPDGRDPSEVVADCLVRVGVVDADYTAERFDEDLERASDSDFQDGPFDVTDPEVQDCLESGGIHISVAD
ncbi:hypothetical protein ABZ635_23950 [Nocardiopsis sp. NPDC007018]|uniref:hypothetical protein n=1 Tax=Nocardiopsis sp. NPDC007018 TaxID=3155721 RepID=UPI0033C59E93